MLKCLPSTIECCWSSWNIVSFQVSLPNMKRRPKRGQNRSDPPKTLFTELCSLNKKCPLQANQFCNRKDHFERIKSSLSSFVQFFQLQRKLKNSEHSYSVNFSVTILSSVLPTISLSPFSLEFLNIATSQ